MAGVLGATALPAIGSLTNLSQILFGSTTLFTTASQVGDWVVPATGQYVPTGVGQAPAATYQGTVMSGTLTNGSATVTVASTAALVVNMPVSDQTNPGDLPQAYAQETYVLAIPNLTTVTLSQPATVSGGTTSDSLLFGAAIVNGACLSAGTNTSLSSQNSPIPGCTTAMTGSITHNSSVITVASTAGIQIGMLVADQTHPGDLPNISTTVEVTAVTSTTTFSIAPSKASATSASETLVLGSFNVGAAASGADTSGQGVLVLTGANGGIPSTHSGCGTAPCGNYLGGGVFLGSSLPSTQGLDIAFNTYQYNLNSSASGADGIGFALAATNPLDPSAPQNLGPVGGSLGYAPHNGANGLPDGFLGFGLDTFGNFETSSYAGTSGCSAATTASSTAIPSPGIYGLTGQTSFPESISVRGPGNGQTGYCLLASSANTQNSGSNNLPFGPDGTAAGYAGTAPNSSQFLDDPQSYKRPVNSGATAQPVAVEIVLNTGATAVTPPDSDGVDWTGNPIAGGDWGIGVTPIEVKTSDDSAKAGTTVVQTGPLPDLCTAHSGSGSSEVCTAAIDGISPSWINPISGLPYQLSLGWTSSTGYDTEAHEVNNFAAQTEVSGVPVLQVASTDSVSHSYSSPDASAQAVNLTLTPSLLGGNGNELDAPTLTDTIPAGIDLDPGGVPATVTAPNWTCSAPTGSVSAGWTLSCTYSATLPVTDPGSGNSTNLGTITIDNASIASTASTGPNLTTPVVISSLDALAGTASDTIKPAGAVNVPTTTVVTPSPASSVLIGQSVTYHATVTASSGASAPTGTLDFTDGGSAIAPACTAVTLVTASPVTNPGSSVASCTVASGYASTAGSPHTIEANYNGPTGLFLASSNTTTETVTTTSTTTTSTTTTSPSGGPIPTLTSVVGTPNPDGTSQPVSYVATVVATTGSAPPTGAVGFSDSGVPIAACQAVALSASDPATSPPSSVATCVTTADPSPGSYPIAASYAPTGLFLLSSGQTTEVVEQPTQTVVVGKPNAANTNQSVTYTATVSATGGTIAPTGTVSFADGSSTIAGCSAAILYPVLPTSSPPSSVATCTVASGYPSIGSHPISSQYNPSGGFESSNGQTTELVVSSPAAKTETPNMTAHADPVTQVYSPGDSVGLTAAALPADASGKVVFTGPGGKVLCSATVVAGKAFCITSSTLPVGRYAVIATYSGDAKYATITATTSFAVTPLGLSLVAKAEPPTSTAGTAVTLTGSGLPSDATGTVKFTSAGQLLCTGTVANASASCHTATSLPAGTYPVLATYSGDSSHPSATAPTSFILTAPVVVLGTTPHDTPLGVSLPSGTGQGPFICKVTSSPPASEGTWTLSPGCKLEFFPASSFTGTVHFTYDVTDARGVLTAANSATIGVGPPASATPIPGTHTGELWSGWTYWGLVSAIGASGLGVIWASGRRDPIL